MPEVWRGSVAEHLAEIDELNRRIAPIDRELAPIAHSDPRAQLLQAADQPFHEHYRRIPERHGKNPAKSAVAPQALDLLLVDALRNQVFRPPHPATAAESSRRVLAA